MTPIEQFIAQMEHDPVDNTDAHPRLFSDLKSETEQYLFDLWQWGCVEAEWDEENSHTKWGMSDFGDEIMEKGVDELYFEMMKNQELYGQEFEIDPTDNLNV